MIANALTQLSARLKMVLFFIMTVPSKVTENARDLDPENFHPKLDYMLSVLPANSQSISAASLIFVAVSSVWVEAESGLHEALQ